ncbi:MAG: hypothetical protein E7673_06930 [Ruminococcaceae bacterium]|nr:hypothetical protein [Oscillospiraceae bacterium]
MKRRVHSFVWGGVAALACIIIGICASNVGEWTVIAVGAFTLTSCLILDNNFVGEMLVEIFGWGFVRMPGVIFSLDLDGIIWLLTVKLLFWVLGVILAVLCGILALALGLIVSVFVYPFALYRSYKEIEY